jgi:hypothetical protein
MNETWRAVLMAALGCNSVLGFGYRLYRMNKGGARADVTGQAVLGVILVLLALALGLGAAWPRWIAFGYGLLFGLVVMPIWVLAVMIPSRPGRVDYAFTAVYWTLLFVIVGGALTL